MIYINEIEVQNFRGIRDTNKPLPLSDFTIIIGRNNAGKTSILEALYLLAGGSDPITTQQRISAISDRHGQNLAYKYTGEATISSKFNNHTLEAQLDNKINHIWVDNEDQGSVLTSLDVIDIELDHLSLLFDAGSNYIDLLSDLGNYDQEIQSRGVHAKAAEFVSEYVHDDFTELFLDRMEIRKNPPNDYPYLVSISDLGRGVIRALPVYIGVEYLNPALILWDDIEASLHPKLLEQVVEWMAESPSQTIISTHSFDLLSIVLEVEPKELTVLNIQKTEDDQLHFESLDSEELFSLINHAGHDPRYLSALSNDESN